MPNVQQRVSPTRADFSAYLQNRKRLSEERERAAAIQSKIAEAEERQSHAVNAAPESAAVKQQAEDLAAAIALGEATTGEAQKRRAEIEKLEASLAKGLAAARAAGEAISGLARKLEKTESEIESLEAQGRKLLIQALRARAEVRWEAYIEHARHVYQSFLTLAALDQLLVNTGGASERIVDVNALHRFFIPAFRLGEVEGVTDPERRIDLFGLGGFPFRLAPQVEEELRAEITRLRALGVEL